MDNPIFKLEKVVQTRAAESMEDFEGPLDLILFLLSKNKIEIQDIPIALILDQYLEYLEKRQQMDLEVASEFVTMASHLMYIKTRMLLSIEDEEAQSEMDALIQSLQDRQRGECYQKIRRLTEKLGPMSEFGRNIFTKNPEPVKRGKVFEYDHEPGELAIAMQELLDRRDMALNPQLTVFEDIVKREPYSVEEKAEEIVQRVKLAGITRFLLLFKGSHSMELEDVVDKLFGTWYHEEFERYDFKTREFKTKDLAFRLYTDHAVVTKKLTTVADVEIPACVEELPVTGIERSVFSGSKYTESVTFPDTLTNIRYCAFYKTNKLKTVSTPPSVRIIDNSAFSTCENLRTVEIAEGCTHLGYRAFGNCKALEKITIPATVRQIGGECFLNCEKLTIHGKAGSYAQQYARGHGIPFCAE